MNLIYKNELSPYLLQPKEDVIAFACTLVESRNATSYQMANELSSMMRREKRYDEATEIARMMFEDSPSVERLNLYFVAAVDQGDIATITRISALADDILQKNGGRYQKHLFATWLKAANKILDDNMFQYVYSQIPMEEKNNNSYIISQYYVYKNRHAQYDDVCSHYERLPAHVQSSFYVKRYYDNARRRLGLMPTPVSSYRVAGGGLETGYRVSGEVADAVDTELSDAVESEMPENDRQKKIFLVYGGNPAILPAVEAILGMNSIPLINLSKQVKTGSTIIEAFEKEADETDFAIVLYTPEDPGAGDIWYPRMNVVFECGYFMAKLGRKNVCLLRQDNGKNLAVPSDFSNIYQISMDKGSWIMELSAALKSAGFNVMF